MQFLPPSKMCLPHTVRVLDPEALPFEIQQGWLAPVDIEEGFVFFTPGQLEEEPIIPDNHEGEFGQPEESVFTDDEMERMWNVYRGIERPNDANDWRACWEYCTQSLYYITGLTYEFEEEWQSAWTDDDEPL